MFIAMNRFKVVKDATGFVELIRTLNVLRRTLDNVRLEIACWTTTGMVRTGNEDGFALIHACESRQDLHRRSGLVSTLEHGQRGRTPQ